MKNGKKIKKREEESVVAMKDIMKRYLITLENGKVIHNMYSTEYTGMGHNVVIKEIKNTDIIRIFDPVLKYWDYASGEDVEKYVLELSKTQKKKNEDIWEDNSYGIYGFVDKTNKFKIRIKSEDGKKSTKGSVCMEASWSIRRIYDLFCR